MINSKGRNSRIWFKPSDYLNMRSEGQNKLIHGSLHYSAKEGFGDWKLMLNLIR